MSELVIRLTWGKWGIAAGADPDRSSVGGQQIVEAKKKGHQKQDPSVDLQGTFSFKGLWCGREGCEIQ